MMKKLFPERDRIVAVVDGTISGMGEHVEFLKFKERHPHLDTIIINTSYYTPSGLKEAFGELGKNDIILFLDFSIDGKNNLYPLANAAYFIYENTNNVPIFRMSSADIRHGVFGGISYSHNEAGKRAGEMARKILNGENPDDMPLITEGITTAYFDQKIMDEFHIRNKDIPASGIIIDEHANLIKFYRENKVLSNMVIIAALLLITVIVLLFWINVHRYKMIRTDFMTGLPNRMLLMERIKQATDSGTHFGIIMMDVDHFKNINDTLGHQSGDEIIIGVANRLKKIAGPGLTFARLGGDEFAGIFVEPSKEKADDICKKIISSMKEQFNISTGTLNITVSVGCAMYPVDTKKVEKVMECADLALYEVKERGRDGYALFNDVDKTG